MSAPVIMCPLHTAEAFVKRASASMRTLVGAASELCEQNEALKLENEELRKQASAAQGKKVTLEKVAGLSVAAASSFVKRLADMAIIPEREMEKYAAACLDRPDTVIELAEKALKLSVAPAFQGYGTTKSAADSSSDTQLNAEMRLLREASVNPAGLPD